MDPFTNISSFYDNVADSYSEFYNTRIGELYLTVTGRRIRDFIENELDVPPHEDIKILDLGCGECTISCRLSEHFPINLTGVDLSSEMLSNAEQNIAESDISAYQLHESDVFDLEYEPAHYDVVLAQGNLLGHIENEEQFLELVGDVLRPNGLAFISIVTQHRYATYHLRHRGWKEFTQTLDTGFSQSYGEEIPIETYRVRDLERLVHENETVDLEEVYPKVCYFTYSNLSEGENMELLEENWGEIKDIELESTRSSDTKHGLQTELVIQKTNQPDGLDSAEI